ncbi:uncharacterized protein UTRI_06322 [Ustilago trichophora]|uniref:Uncharacterized protein n=1 Tax=Ustilago trichophora TaxID=86804 RepID=A0A5C3EIY7_9BASI|nr:uncharacterized protein UTRI_06322 [Ustilago trichophora]
MATRPWPSLLCTPWAAPLPFVPGGAFLRSTREDRRVDATCRFPSGKSSSELRLPAEYFAPVCHFCAQPLLHSSGLHLCPTLVSPREACNSVHQQSHLLHTPEECSLPDTQSSLLRTRLQASQPSQ